MNWFEQNYKSMKAEIYIANNCDFNPLYANQEIKNQVRQRWASPEWRQYLNVDVASQLALIKACLYVESIAEHDPSCMALKHLKNCIRKIISGDTRGEIDAELTIKALGISS